MKFIEHKFETIQKVIQKAKAASDVTQKVKAAKTIIIWNPQGKSNKNVKELIMFVCIC